MSHDDGRQMNAFFSIALQYGHSFSRGTQRLEFLFLPKSTCQPHPKYRYFQKESIMSLFQSLFPLPAPPQLDRKSMDDRTEQLDMTSTAVTLISVSPNCIVALISLLSGLPPPAPPTAPRSGKGSGRSKVIVPHFLTPGSEMYITSSVALQ